MKIDNLVIFTNSEFLDGINKIPVEILKEDGSKEIKMGYEIKLLSEDYIFDKDTYKKFNVNGLDVINDKI